MKCENCKQYESEPLWNRCNLTEAECFHTIDNCDLVDDEGNDTGEYDRLLSGYQGEMDRIQTEVLQEQEPDWHFLMETLKTKDDELQTLRTDNPQLNIMPLEEAEERRGRE